VLPPVARPALLECHDIKSAMPLMEDNGHRFFECPPHSSMCERRELSCIIELAGVIQKDNSAIWR
jgi:hypothetical protein